ncbi:Putative peptidoglycan binding domain protein [Thalassovita gelatinovora]|uniref:Putative peptidoglycan binding domain protein n=1 Tax=Thalassovita gelatinovora TaxID=53501 RepID=A0A0P1G5D1_THAGE|nr:peptidoglycan-binding protein [Thalassovita gelatinovora]QIZ79083.1 TIGR02594 family protein [Thalassovita gelatinovora]CUH68708.1 Putative peptidoglycan binding domain protein [Thalassovita gelatinovora]
MSQTFDVRWLQRALKTLGFNPGPIDGIKGPRTDAAIVAFKHRFGFRQRPYLGPITLAALRDAVVEAMPTRFGPDTAPEPPWMVEISKFIGLHEVRDNAAVRAWLRSDGATLGDPAQLPWCGDAAATALKKALPDEAWPDRLEANPYWARNFTGFGIACRDVYGAVFVFSRGKGGHVGFAIGRSADGSRYRIRGGNQGDMIRDSWMAASRVLARRWPATWPAAYQRPLPVLDASGAVLSVNEA